MLAAAAGARAAAPMVDSGRGRRWRCCSLSESPDGVCSRADYFWKNPLAGARFTRLTDWEGSELDAAISSDGKFVSIPLRSRRPIRCLGDSGGQRRVPQSDQGPVSGALNSIQVRNVGFSDDDAHVWIRIGVAGVGGRSDAWLVPTMGGTLAPFLPNAVQVAWSPDRTRILYPHVRVRATPSSSPTATAAIPGRSSSSKPGIHNHYRRPGLPTAASSISSRAYRPDDMDIWRIPSEGGAAERLTNHHSRVAYPPFSTSAHCSTRPRGRTARGPGFTPWTSTRRIPHAVSSGLEEYVSVAASADGRRLVATVANPSS